MVVSGAIVLGIAVVATAVVEVTVVVGATAAVATAAEVVVSLCSAPSSYIVALTMTLDYGYGGSSAGGFRDDAGRRGFQEYDAGDDEELPRRSNSVSSRPSAQRRSSAAHTSAAATPVTPKAPEPAPAPVVDLLGMDDDFASAPPAASADKALPAVSHQATTVTDGTVVFRLPHGSVAHKLGSSRR